MTSVPAIAGRRVRTMSVSIADGSVRHFEGDGWLSLFGDNDLVVVNDAATIPASFAGRHLPSGDEIEIRLLASLNSQFFGNPWRALVLGRGNWRLPTESRVNVPEITNGDRIELDQGLFATVTGVKERRLVDVRFSCRESDLFEFMYRCGKYIQYAHTTNEKRASQSQTLFSWRPAAFEPPSAVFNLDWQSVFRLKRQGVRVVNLTHACTISSTGEPRLDAELPFEERYFIPAHTALALERSLRRGERIVAFGTSVVRAAESAYDVDEDKIRPGTGSTKLYIDEHYRRRVIDGLLTGLHEEGTSHRQILRSFVPDQWITRAYGEGAQRGYLGHENGDSCIIL